MGRYALVVSPDLFLDLQRLQPNTGLLEIDRIKKLIGDNVYMTSVMGPGKAVLVCAEPEYLDLAIGLDLSVGYLELADFNLSLIHISEPTRQAEISYAVFCLKKKKERYQINYVYI